MMDHYHVESQQEALERAGHTHLNFCFRVVFWPLRLIRLCKCFGFGI